ncbi:unnamed protein product [Cylindrotheca closterium]|uniref:Uncharacterized protein n=1 Tax=Cylindrotheca closterium TaxID=2856 RepID=A0AAD2PXS2_9STRA|nr:unnamed protein product [Cylindrotheca closterium]
MTNDGFCDDHDGDDDNKQMMINSHANNSSAEVDLPLDSYQQRKQSYQRKVAKEILRRPPNPFLSPVDFVQELLRELRQPHDSQSGYLCLLESSTFEWRRILFGSIGASIDTATNAEVAAFLEGLFRKKDNQFGILVGADDDDEEGYLLEFPADFESGKEAWVECRLFSVTNGELLAVTGWCLEQRAPDGAWQLNRLDWQDFRDKYRPGLGREEWERICG